MASPQLENGYTPIANEIMEALGRSHIPGEARQVLDVIIRKTYGFRKKDDWISLSQFVDGTNMDRPEVCRGIRKLLLMKIIDKSKGKRGSIYSLHKDYKHWQVAKSPRGKKDNPPVAKLPIRPVAKLPHTKETITKERITKTIMRKKTRKIENSLSASDYTDVYKIIDAFEPVNRFWHTLHEQAEQYEAALQLLKTCGLEKTLKVIGILPQTNKMAFISKALTPKQLVKNWSAIEAQLRSQTNKKVGEKTKIIL